MIVRRPFRVLQLAIMVALFCVRVDAAGPRHPFPLHAKYESARLRPTGLSVSQQDADVRAYYDLWKSQFVLPVPGTSPVQYRIAFGKALPNRAVTVSEGQGYGMVIVALMAGHDTKAQTVFDGLWRFARANPSSGDPRLMAWRVPTATGDAPDSAFDGDADMAYALLIADSQWGSTGAIKYRTAAKILIDGILTSTMGPKSHLPMPGDWVDPNGSQYNQYTTRTSDFFYGHFRAYSRAFKNSTWDQSANLSQGAVSRMQDMYAPKTGLLPDFAIPRTTLPVVLKPAGPDFLEGPNDGFYSYNACRTPWRIGTDALLNSNAVSLSQSQKMSLWIEKSTSGNVNAINAGYHLNGVPISGGNYFTTAFVAPFGVAAMTSPRQQAWLDKIYLSVRTRHEDYYEDSITLMCLLVMTENFWDPTLLP